MRALARVARRPRAFWLLGLAGLLAPGPSASAILAGEGGLGCGMPGAVCEVWSVSHAAHSVAGLALSLDDTVIFTSQHGSFPQEFADFVTMALDAVSGEELWTARDGFGLQSEDRATDIALSPDGTTVLVGGSTGLGAAMVAYDARAGTRLWRIEDHREAAFGPVRVGWSSDGATAFLSNGRTRAAAFDTATQRSLWTTSWPMRFGVYQINDLLVLDDAMVTLGLLENTRLAVHGVDLATGKTLWTLDHLPPGMLGMDPEHLERAGDDILVAASAARTSDWRSWDFYVARVAQDGHLAWEATVDATGSQDLLLAVEVAPTRVFVTGWSYLDACPGGAPACSYPTMTFALDAADGQVVWSHAFAPASALPRSWRGYGLAYDPLTDRLLVTGGSPRIDPPYFFDSRQYVLALDASTGGELFSHVRLPDPSFTIVGNEHAEAVVASRPEGRVFTLGEKGDGNGDWDSVVVAYEIPATGQLARAP